MTDSMRDMGENGSANQTLSCTAWTIQPMELPFPEVLLTMTRGILLVCFVLISFFGTVLNSLLLFLMCKFKNLRTWSFFVVAQIAVINLLASLITMPINVVGVSAQQWPLGEHVCGTVGFFRSWLDLLRVLVMLVFVTDRCCTVFLPFLYPNHRVKVVTCLTVGVHVIALVASVLPVGLSCLGYNMMSFTCHISSICSNTCRLLYLSLGGVLYIPADFLPVVFYIALFCKARKLKNAVVQTSNDLAHDPETPKREWRVTHTFFLVFLALFLVKVPPGFALMIVYSIGLSPRESLTAYMIDVVSSNMFKVKFITDPVFILRNRDIKEAMLELSWMPKALLWC